VEKKNFFQEKETHRGCWGGERKLLPKHKGADRKTEWGKKKKWTGEKGKKHKVKEGNSSLQKGKSGKKRKNVPEREGRGDSASPGEEREKTGGRKGNSSNGCQEPNWKAKKGGGGS